MLKISTASVPPVVTARIHKAASAFHSRAFVTSKNGQSRPRMSVYKYISLPAYCILNLINAVQLDGGLAPQLPRLCVCVFVCVPACVRVRVARA